MKKVIGFLVIAAFLGVFGLADQSLAAAGPFKWKLQTAHPAGAPQIHLLNKMVADIDKMSGGRLKIEVLASGAIVNPFEILDGVNKGIIEAGQWWTHYSMGKNPSGSLFSSPLGGAGSGLDMMNHLSWYMNGGGRELYVEYYQKILKTDVMPFLIAPDGPEAFGWAKKAPKTLSDVRKLNKIQPVEEIVTPIKDEGKHQIPNDNSLRFAAKDVRQKMSFGLWNTEMAREDARSTIDQKS